MANITRGIVLLAALAVLILPATASAATRLVSPGGADTGDCTVNACLHIQYAVNQASANDEVSVAAGTYDSEPSNRVVINKGLTLRGEGAGQTILNGNAAHRLPSTGGGTFRIDSTSPDPINVSDLTITGAGSTAASHGNDPHIAVLAQGVAATPATWTFEHIRIEGSNSATGRDYGFDAQISNANLILRDSEIVGTNFNPVLLERFAGTADINGNTITKGPGVATAYFDMNYSSIAGNPTSRAGLHQFRNNVVDANGSSAVSINGGFGGAATGPYSAIRVSGNRIADVGASGLGVVVNNGGPGAGTATAIADADITDNVVTGPGSIGIRFTGLIEDIDVTGNQLTDFTRGIQFNAASTGHAPAASDVNLNRIVNSSAAGLELNAGGNVNAENDWWGCNEGPNSDPGCSGVVGAGVDFDPWLVLGLSADPTSIPTGGSTSLIDADLTHNSDGLQPGTALPDGFSVAFDTDLGSVTSPHPFTAGMAQSTLTSGDEAGVAKATATVDNESPTTPVTVTAPTPESGDSGASAPESSSGEVLGSGGRSPRIKRRIRPLNVPLDGSFQIATVRCRAESCTITEARARVRVGRALRFPPVTVHVRGKGETKSLSRRDVARVVIHFPQEVERELVVRHFGKLTVDVVATSDGGGASAHKRIRLKAKYLKRLVR